MGIWTGEFYSGAFGEFSPGSYNFLILDELGFLPFALSGGLLLFHPVSKLYERTSTLVSTKLAFGK